MNSDRLPVFSKVKAGTAGGGAGVAAARVVEWLVESGGTAMPDPVVTSLGVVLAAVGAFAAGWLKRERQA